jgi:hypothetical protein
MQAETELLGHGLEFMTYTRPARRILRKKLAG